MNDTFIFQLTLPIVFVVSGFVLGLIAQRALIAVGRRLLARLPTDGVITRSARGMILVWFVALGVYAALTVMPLEEMVDQVSRDVLEAVVIVSITLVIARIASGLLNLAFDRLNEDAQSSTLVPTATYLFILLVGALVVAQNVFGWSITPILTTLGVGGLAVALALQDTLANLFAGFYITLIRG